MKPIIRFENVSKRFAFSRERPQTIVETITSSFHRKSSDKKTDYLWALEGVSFDVMPGQSVGIVGRNGSGKSTALKLAAGILRPTHGQVSVRGRVSALLELGAGFHQDLTGRENVYLNGSLLGLGKEEIDAKFERIVAFSELGDFIDMPVKHYSSGMYMRLGFSVAIHVDPEILIIDEILAVGDRPFQMKCLDAIFSLKGRGVTIVFVSHSLDMVRRLCSHLVWIERGKLRSVGVTAEVAEEYAAYFYNPNGSTEIWTQNEDFVRTGSKEIEITGVRFFDCEGVERNTFKTGEAVTMEMDYFAHEGVENPEFGFSITTQNGILVNGPNNLLAGVDTGRVVGKGQIRYHIERLLLLPAHYAVTAAIHDSRLSFAYDYHKEAYSLVVSSGGTEEYQGVVALPATWEWNPETEEGT